MLANIIEDAENRANEKQQEEPMETKDKNKDAVLSFEKYETMSPEDKYSLLSSFQERLSKADLNVIALIEKHDGLVERVVALEEVTKKYAEEAEKNTSEKAELAKSLDELKEKFTGAVEENKKLKVEGEARLDKMEKSIESYDSTFAKVGKRLGIKTSLPVEDEEKNKEEEAKADPFGDAMRNKKKKD